MKRSILIVLLGLGAIAGYASGFGHWHWGPHYRYLCWERHWAQICADAAREGRRAAPPPADALPPTEDRN